MIKTNKVDIFNPLSAIPTKWPNTFKQFVGTLPKVRLILFLLVYYTMNSLLHRHGHRTVFPVLRK